MRRKIRTDVPTLWLDKYDMLIIVWPEGEVTQLRYTITYDYPHFEHEEKVWMWRWISSINCPEDLQYLKRTYHYCGPLFVSKENKP